MDIISARIFLFLSKYLHFNSIPMYLILLIVYTEIAS
jgi:hypothetical protein